MSMKSPDSDDENLRQRTVCALCGRRALEGTVFEVTTGDTGRYAVCPGCRYTSVQSQASTLVIPVILVGILFLLGTAWDPRPNAGRVVVNACAGWLIMLLTVLPHEFAPELTPRCAHRGGGGRCGSRDSIHR